MTTLISSPLIKRLLIGLSALVILSAVFTLGIHIGERKAGHFSGWQRGYRHMMPSHHGFLEREEGGLPSRPLFPNGHGVFGNVLSVSSEGLVIQGKDGIEQAVLVTSSTMIRVGEEAISFQDFPKDLTKLQVSAFGTPNSSGQINARLIRLFTQP